MQRLCCFFPDRGWGDGGRSRVVSGGISVWPRYIGKKTSAFGAGQQSNPRLKVGASAAGMKVFLLLFLRKKEALAFRLSQTISAPGNSG
jgi:hypothetical protein